MSPVQSQVVLVVFSEIGSGQTMTGFSLSITSIVCVQEFVFLPSETVQVRVVTLPIANESVSPIATVLLTSSKVISIEPLSSRVTFSETISQLSANVGVSIVPSHLQEAIAFTSTLVPQVIVGLVLSSTLIFWSQLSLLPDASSAYHLIMFSPFSNV